MLLVFYMSFCGFQNILLFPASLQDQVHAKGVVFADELPENRIDQNANVVVGDGDKVKHQMKPVTHQRLVSD